MLKTIIVFLLVIITCSCVQQKPTSVLSTKANTNQELHIKNKLKFDSEPMRGTVFTDLSGTEYIITHIKTTITNDSLIPINIQMDLPIEHNYLIFNEYQNFKILVWRGLSEPPHLYSDHPDRLLEDISSKELETSNKFSQHLEPGDQYILTIGTIYRKPVTTCSVVAYKLLEYNDRRQYPDCEWTIGNEQVTDPHSALGLQLGFCTVGLNYKSCTIIKCGQIIPIKD